jgi:membrane protease YdiL (CAAX protease family)
VGIAGGAVLYLVSMSVVQARIFNAGEYLSVIGHALSSHSSLRRISVLGARALYEEAFWRGTIQPFFSDSFFGVVIVSFLFTLQHFYYSYTSGRTMHRRVLFEFLLFSLAVGTIYAVTGRLLLVVGVHWARNLLIDAARAQRCSVSLDSLRRYSENGSWQARVRA